MYSTEDDRVLISDVTYCSVTWQRFQETCFHMSWWRCQLFSP